MAELGQVTRCTEERRSSVGRIGVKQSGNYGGGTETECTIIGEEVW